MYLVRVDNSNTAKVSLGVCSTSKGAQDIPGELVRHVGGRASGGAGGQGRADKVGGDFLEVASASVVSGTPTAVYDSQGTTRGQVDHQESGANVVSHKGRVSAGTEKAAETQIHRDRRQLSIHERVP
jgi:hypothetical protein